MCYISVTQKADEPSSVKEEELLNGDDAAVEKIKGKMQCVLKICDRDASQFCKMGAYFVPSCD